MISKRFQTAFWDRDLPGATLLNVWGRGWDTGQLNKVAADFTLYDWKIKPEKGYSFVHLITTGAGEYYSTNANGDYFNEDYCTVSFPEGTEKTASLDGGLKKYHSTYRKYGAVYRNHFNSKKGGKPEGEIVWETYNPVMHRGELVVKLADDKWGSDIEKLASGNHLSFSMGCFEKGALVTCNVGGIKTIEDVAVGDYVLTHTGQYCEVTATRKLNYSDIPVYTVKSSGLVPVTCTGNHPFFVIHKDFVLDAKTGRQRTNINILTDGIWLPAEQLTEDYFCVCPIESNTYHPDDVDEDFARLCGYYLAEGHMLRSIDGKIAGMRFCAHKQDALVQKLPSIIERLSRTKCAVLRHVSNSEKACSIDVYDSELAERVYELFHEYSKDKSINSSVFMWDTPMQWELLGAYHEGDGFVYHRPNAPTKVNVSFSTASRKLVCQLQSLVARLGFPASCHMLKHRTSKSKSTSLGHTFEYVLRCGLSFTDALKGYSDKLTDVQVDFEHSRPGGCRIVNGFLISRIKQIKETPRASTVVYNLEIEEEDHSYIVNNMAVHNCSVKYDLCNICGNKAKNRSEYCEHLRFEKLAVHDSGLVVSCYNDAPHFHDISVVDRPADRIALGLSKVASGSSIKDAIEETSGLYLPVGLVKKLMGKVEADKYALLQKCAALEEEFSCKGIDPTLRDLATSCMHTDGEEQEIVKKLASIPLDKLFSELNRKEMLLTPKSFVRIVLPEKEETGIPDITSLVKSVFSDVVNSGDVQDVLNDSSFSPCVVPDRGVAEQVDGLSDLLSLEQEPVTRRIIKISIIGEPVKNKEATVADESNKAKYLAREYAKYQISFLANNPDKVMLVALQNQVG